MDDKNVPVSLHQFSIDTFKKSIDNMIATTDNSYNTVYNIGHRKHVREYTEDEIKRIIDGGSIQAQQELSYNYYVVDGFYRRILIYYATMLKYLGILIPDVEYGRKIESPHLQKRYYKAMDFVDMINVQSIAANMMLKALIYGCYYGVIQTLDRENFSILDLPSSYCYSRYKDVKNNDLIEFDLAYFNSLTEAENVRARALAAYPDEIVRAYDRWSRGRGPRYYPIPSTIGICIPFFDGRPFFLPIIPDIVNYRDYQALEKAKDADEIKKILVQQIPHLNTGELLFEPPEAEEIHRGTVSMLKNNPNVSVLTTYADVDVQGTNATNESVTRNNLDKIANSVYRAAGLSPNLFAATGNLALTTSIQNDLALIMPTAYKISNFITNIVNRLYSNGAMKFSYTMLPITYYNEKEYTDNVFKGATSGYSFLLPGIAMGLSQKNLVNVKNLENKVLKLDEILIPLKTSYTESSGNGVGRPALADEQKSDKTIRNIEAGNGGGEE